MFITKIRAQAAPGEDRSPSGDFWFNPVNALAAGMHVTASTALALPEVFACVRVLAESFAVLPFRLYRPKADGRGRERIKLHWLTRLFCKAPNRFQSPYEWREMLMGHLALRGNAFCQITSNARGEITELLPLHPDRMRIEMLESGNYRYRYTDQQGRTVYYTRFEVWHIRGLSSDGLVGMSPIDLEREAIGEGLAMQRFAGRFFANDARPSGGWIEYPGRFANPDAKRKFRDSWQELQGGSNRGKVAVLEQGMKFHELGVSQKDSQFIEARAAKPAQIARIFRVPPHMIGDLSRSTNNNIEHQGIEFWQGPMLSWTERLESSIEFFLLGEDSDLEVEFDMRHMMRGDSKSRAEYINTLVQGGVLVRNEGREIEGYEPLEGLDEPLQPLNMAKAGATPEDQAGPPPDAGATAGRLQRLLTANAARLARRFSRGDGFDAVLIAEAMAVPVEQAAAWVQAANESTFTEESLRYALMGLGAAA